MGHWAVLEVFLHADSISCGNSLDVSSSVVSLPVLFHFGLSMFIQTVH